MSVLGLLYTTDHPAGKAGLIVVKAPEMEVHL